MFRRLWEKLRQLWKLAKSERATPWEIGWAVGIGAFAGCTPAIGVHGWLALGLATVFKKNRLFAWLGSRISNMIMLPFIALAEVQVAHLLRTGRWLEIDINRHNAIEMAGSLLVDWCIGTVPVGVAIGGVMGLAAFGLAHRRDARRRRAEARDARDARVEEKSDGPTPPPPPDEDPRPSSESPA